MSELPIDKVIERVKRYIYATGHSLSVLPPWQGAEDVPLPTLEELCLLVDLLLEIPAGSQRGNLVPLHEFRMMDLERTASADNRIVTSGAIPIGWRPSNVEWAHAARAADHVMNVLKEQLVAEAPDRPSGNAIYRVGDIWHIHFEGEHTELKDRKCQATIISPL